MEFTPESLEEELSSYALHDAAEINDEILFNKLRNIQENRSILFTTVVALKQLVNSTDSAGCTPLHIAIINGHVRAVEILIAAGAQISKACGGCPPVHLAVCTGQAACAARRQASAAIVAALLAQGADPQERDDYGRTALHWAVCALTDVDVIRQLLESAEASQAARLDALAADVASGLVLPPDALQHILAAQDNEGFTVLHLACKFRHFEALRVLLSWAEQATVKAEPGAAAMDLDTAPTTAAEEVKGEKGAGGAHAAGVPTPLDAVTLVKAMSKEGTTALHMAADKGCAAAVAALVTFLQLPTSPPAALAGLLAAQDKKGRTAAALAARKGHSDLAKALEALAAAAGAPPLSEERNAKDPSASEGAAPELDLDIQDDKIRGVLKTLEADGFGPGSTSSASAPSVTNALGARTLIVAPPECVTLHRTAPEPYNRAGLDPPPENPDRLKVLTSPGSGILLSREFLPPRQRPSGAEREGDSESAPRGVVWETDSVPDAAMADVLKVHEWAYVLALQKACEAVPPGPAAVRGLDQDTAICHDSMRAALKAAGAVCAAVDRLVTGHVSNAFCAVRPPGHHAGPTGSVSCAADPAGSSAGFCLFNNAAIGAAYALDVYRHSGIRRVAILDFDVHHGNGTQACVLNTSPGSQTVPMDTPFSRGQQVFPTYKPWLAPGPGDGDKGRIFFASVQGFGRKSSVNPSGGWFYPGSGGTADSCQVEETPDAAAAADTDAKSSGDAVAEGAAPSLRAAEDPAAVAAGGDESARGREFEGELEHCLEVKGGPRIVNIGVPGPGGKPKFWRRAWRDKVLPSLVEFGPDIIFVSAGFDAHRKEEMNHRFVGVSESDYEWLTQQLVEIANTCCAGRIVSVLEGGYNLSGGAAASPFARSVASHVRVLSEPNAAQYDPAEAELERELERAAERQAKQRKLQKAAAKQQAAAAAAVGLGGGPDGASAASGSSGPSGGNETLREGAKRRRRAAANVDYAALNAQLDAEAAAVTAAAATQSGAKDLGQPL